MEEKKTKIELNNEEAELFFWCWKHFDILNTARKVKPGQVVLHLDLEGNIKKPEFHIYKLKDIDKLFDKIL